jgi:hypothetical protein
MPDLTHCCDESACSRGKKTLHVMLCCCRWLCSSAAAYTAVVLSAAGVKRRYIGLATC